MAAAPAPTEPRIGTELTAGTPDLHDDVVITRRELAAPYWAEASVEFAELAECRILKGSFADSHWYKSRWNDALFEGTDLANVEFSGGWTRVALRHVRATGLLSTETVWEHVQMTDTIADFFTLRFSTLRTVTFTRCAMTGADFTGSTLRNVHFAGCDLTGAHFDQASLEQVTFLDCDLTGLSGVLDLRGATVEPRDPQTFAQQLANAIGITLR